MEKIKQSLLAKTAKLEISDLDNGNVWLEKPEMIKKFIEGRPDFEKLCAEVAYIVSQGSEEYDRYLAKNGRDFLNSNAITSLVVSLFFVDKDYTPAEHIKQLFPKYAEFV